MKLDRDILDGMESEVVVLRQIFLTFLQHPFLRVVETSARKEARRLTGMLADGNATVESAAYMRAKLHLQGSMSDTTVFADAYSSGLGDIQEAAYAEQQRRDGERQRGDVFNQATEAAGGVLGHARVDDSGEGGSMLDE